MASSFLLRGQQVRWIGMWIQWDANFYLDIARHGYHAPSLTTGEESGQSTLNFFPMLPLGIRLLAHLLGSSSAPGPITGLLFTNLCVIEAAIVLHRLTCLRVGRSAANGAVLSMMFLPGSVTLFGVMSEAPFVALSFTAAYLACRHRQAGAAVCLSLLLITRLTGLGQAAGAILDWLLGRLRGDRMASFRRLFWLCLIPLPLLLYFVSMWRITGDALVAIHSHETFWNVRPGIPFQNFVMSFWSQQRRLQVQGGLGLTMLVVLLLHRRMFGAGEWLFLGLNLEMSSSGLSLAPSLLRFLVALYPLHMAFGRLLATPGPGRWLFLVLAAAGAAIAASYAHGSDFLQ